jgi:tRNA threonylcarbamoyladenosine modification (KEOPS) complex Cgi121 subunit
MALNIPKLEVKGIIIERGASKGSIDEILHEIRKIKKRDVVLQIFDSDSIANKAHLIGAYLNTLIAFKNSTNKTKTPAMEMLLFAAMTEQVDDAIRIAGAKRNGDFVVFSNNAAAFSKLKRLLKQRREFRPSPAHVKSVMKRFGIKYGKGKSADTAILQRIATVRLGS